MFALSACATAPQTYSFEKSRKFDASFDDVWEGVISYFAENNISIKTLEKDSGLVVAENDHFPAGELTKYADCGTNSMVTNAYATGKINVFIRAVGPDTTKIQTNAKFIQTAQSSWDRSTIVTPCNSKGTLEQAVLDSIEYRIE